MEKIKGVIVAVLIFTSCQESKPDGFVQGQEGSVEFKRYQQEERRLDSIHEIDRKKVLDAIGKRFQYLKLYSKTQNKIYFDSANMILPIIDSLNIVKKNSYGKLLENKFNPAQ